MNSYKFHISNYHSIQNADIILDGLTVVAGLNGCGKSTISRWLTSFINVSNSFDSLIDANSGRMVHERLNNLTYIQRSVESWMKDMEFIRPERYSGSLSSESLQYEKRVRSLSEAIRKVSSQRDISSYEEWLWKALKVEDYKSKNLEKCISTFEALSLDWLAGIKLKTDEAKQDRSLTDLRIFMEINLGSNGKGPEDFNLFENNMPLIREERFLTPLSLKRAIYIDSPMSVSNKMTDANESWNNLMQMLTTPVKEPSEAAGKILLELRHIIGGDIIVKKDDISPRRELRYVRREDGLNIPVEEIATGMKSFSYLIRLIENGYLDEETLLVIDEPEAHLHPQWIVRFAKILVMIQKYLGTKILIASHDPDMVAAISTMSEAEGMTDVTNFYQSKRVPGSMRYEFQYSGNDVSSIFECFNIAIDCIDSYKPTI